MAGQIEERKLADGSPSYRLVVYIGREGGKRERVKRTLPRGTSRKEADRALAKFVSDVDAEHVKPKAGSMTLGDLRDLWRDKRYPDFAPSTRRGYDRDWMRLPEKLRKTPLAKLRPQMLDGLYADLLRSGLAKTTVNHTHVLVSSILTTGWRWDLVPFDHAARRATPPSNTPPARLAPTPEVVTAMLSLALERDFEQGVFFRLSAATGARRGEVAALTWDAWRDETLTIAYSLTGDDEDWRRLVKKDTKTHGVRPIGLDETTVELLKQHRRNCAKRALQMGASLPPNGYLFSATPDGATPIHPDTWTQRWNRLCKEAKVDGVRLHDLRHFLGTELADVLPTKVVMKILGHSRMSTTDMYVGRKAARDRSAAEAIGRVLG